MDIWDYLFDQGLIEGDVTAYQENRGLSEQDYEHAIKTALDAADTAQRRVIVDSLFTSGIAKGDPQYWYTEPAEGDDGLVDAVEAYTVEVPESSLPTPGQRDGTVEVGNTTLPSGLRLVRVTNPSGSDAGEIFFAVGAVFGIEVAYEIGDQARLDDEFGGVGSFADYTSVTQSQFDNSSILSVGSIDEIAGSSDSLQAQYERDATSLGLESPPAWVRDDQAAMGTIITATNEGWSSERTWNALATLDSFKDRFTGIATIQGQLGISNVSDAVTEHIARENGIRAALQRYRGPNTNVDTAYLGSLVSSGWQVAEVTELVELEAEVKNNSEALDNINEILAYQGQDVLTPDDFVSYLQAEARSTETDFTPNDLFESVNDALRLTALERAGLSGISSEQAAGFGSGASFSIESPTAFNDQAQHVAGIVAANAHALDLGSYDLSQETVLDFFLSGKSDVDPEVGRKLEKLGREKNIAGQGYASSSAYIDGGGRLRVQGEDL